MPKRLLVMRHAKSSWKSGAETDHQRPLNKRGRRDAPRMAARLAALGWIPERVISSDSQRTRETWGLLEEVFEAALEVTFTRELYLAGPAEVEAELRALPDEVSTALVLGHNPGWEEVVSWLTREHHSMTTANVALASVEAATWAEALDAASTWTLHDLLRPKDLPDHD
jgi:phosphohistidine phosphatase